MSKIYFLTVIGEDRPGIIAGVTRILFNRRCNLEDMSMSLLDGKFAMIAVYTQPASVKQETLEREILAFSRRRRLFHFTRDLGQAKLRRARKKSGARTCLIQALGPDQTGIVFRISRLLARNRLNITDLHSEVIRSGRKNLYALALETEIPAKFPMKRLNQKLEKIGRELHIEVQIKAVETLTF